MPGVKLQLLIYPVTDAGLNTPSYSEFDGDFGLTAASMRRFFNLYLDGASGLHPDVSPLRADLTDAPPAYVITASHDVLRDDGEALREGAPAGGAASRRGQRARLLALADDRDRARDRA